jgi:hypothetical protein
MNDMEIDNVKSFTQIMQVYHANRLHELTVDKLLECHRQCVAIAKAITPDEPAGTKDRAIAIGKVIDFELNTKLTLESQSLIKRQIAELEKNTEVSKNQLETTNALTKEAKATTKLTKTLTALTWVIAIYTAIVASPIIGDITDGLVKFFKHLMGYPIK